MGVCWRSSDSYALTGVGRLPGAENSNPSVRHQEDVVHVRRADHVAAGQQHVGGSQGIKWLGKTLSARYLLYHY